jgi:hypothetical protein
MPRWTPPRQSHFVGLRFGCQCFIGVSPSILCPPLSPGRNKNVSTNFSAASPGPATPDEPRTAAAVGQPARSTRTASTTVPSTPARCAMVGTRTEAGPLLSQSGGRFGGAHGLAIRCSLRRVPGLIAFSQDACWLCAVLVQPPPTTSPRLNFVHPLPLLASMAQTRPAPHNEARQEWGQVSEPIACWDPAQQCATPHTRPGFRRAHFCLNSGLLNQSTT